MATVIPTNPMRVPTTPPAIAPTVPCDWGIPPVDDTSVEPVRGGEEMNKFIYTT